MPTAKVLRYFAFTFLVFAATLTAQPTGNWTNVKALVSGTPMRITAGSQTVTGRFQTASDESVLVNFAKGPETFARPQVQQVAVRKAGRRRRNMLIGLAAGAGLGLVAGSVTDSKCAAASCFWGPNIGKALLAPTGAILGLAVGLAWPTGGWRYIFKQ